MKLACGHHPVQPVPRIARHAGAKPCRSYIQAIDPTKFAAVTPGAKTDVTLMELPNYALNIPQGAILYGWDGTR